MSADHSRSMKLAGDASELTPSALERHLDSTHVVLSIDAEYPTGMLAGKILMTTLRRGPGKLTLLANNLPASYVDEVEATCRAIDPGRPIGVLRTQSDGPDVAVRLHFGPSARAIRVVSDGYGAHLLANPATTVTPLQSPNALGATFAAALAASEVFKFNACVREDRRILHEYLSYCPFSLSSDMSLSVPLLSPVVLDATLVGVGAIGTAIVFLLDALQFSGRITLVDRQTFGIENVSTYSIGTRADAERTAWKVDLAKQVLTSFDAHTVTDPVESLPALIGSGAVLWSPLVLSALDTPESRRATQRLWPDHLIDAQTGDSMVGFCEYRHGVDPCLMCSFPVDVAARSGVHALAERLGLSPELFGTPGAVLDESHLEGMTDEHRERLKPLIGKPVCALMDGAVSDLDATGFQPSAPFVALQAACLSVARLIASTLDDDRQSNFAQYDALIGPQYATVETMKPRRDCICQTRRATIEQVRRTFRT